ncbi:SDR family NAD(P)-dependent oxidoreductase [Croceicoccus naphthovorans]|uniref:Uncharacterized protein n=1 Tax=Croceicoccus naphthovorans TaxID=1348774 RepID=A0A0G3XH17_9SPHN|nr:SDR family NAD(P)-dependent oxidoreductase [Croceicoccus naphthovorans]AKM09931.1 hypothetical protein AB433_07980 [Croceicoccus naphthovorans]MBB3990918.1 NAD(P)-dependent dehydrogenase (short-subunit alcohol dehydrogenase family) [Croceicoccus naphthovorans]
MRCAVFGSTGGIGAALVDRLLSRSDVSRVYCVSRRGEGLAGGRAAPLAFDLRDEASIERAALEMGQEGALDLVIVATGILTRDPGIAPEKTWRAIDPAAMADVFALNTIGPALVGKHVLPLLAKDRAARMAFLSARVGSIGDNGLGGWHSYRASKAALNMLVRNFAIELRRSNPRAIVAALHPGTVATALSQPFSGNVPNEKLFDADYAAGCLLDVLSGLSPQDSGEFFAWDGRTIAW